MEGGPRKYEGEYEYLTCGQYQQQQQQQQDHESHHTNHSGGLPVVPPRSRPIPPPATIFNDPAVAAAAAARQHLDRQLVHMVPNREVLDQHNRIISQYEQQLQQQAELDPRTMPIPIPLPGRDGQYYYAPSHTNQLQHAQQHQVDHPLAIPSVPPNIATSSNGHGHGYFARGRDGERGYGYHPPPPPPVSAPPPPPPSTSSWVRIPEPPPGLQQPGGLPNLPPGTAYYIAVVPNSSPPPPPPPPIPPPIHHNGFHNNYPIPPVPPNPNYWMAQHQRHPSLHQRQQQQQVSSPRSPPRLASHPFGYAGAPMLNQSQQPPRDESTYFRSAPPPSITPPPNTSMQLASQSIFSNNKESSSSSTRARLDSHPVPTSLPSFSAADLAAYLAQTPNATPTNLKLTSALHASLQLQQQQQLLRQPQPTLLDQEASRLMLERAIQNAMKDAPGLKPTPRLPRPSNTSLAKKPSRPKKSLTRTKPKKKRAHCASDSESSLSSGTTSSSSSRRQRKHKRPRTQQYHDHDDSIHPTTRKSLDSNAFLTIIHCGLGDIAPTIPFKIYECYSPYFGKIVPVYRAEIDPYPTRMLFRASTFANKVHCNFNRVSMYLARQKGAKHGIFQARGFAGKPNGATGLKSTGYFISIHACIFYTTRHIMPETKTETIRLSSSLETHDGKAISETKEQEEEELNSLPALEPAPNAALPTPSTPTTAAARLQAAYVAQSLRLQSLETPPEPTERDHTATNHTSSPARPATTPSGLPRSPTTTVADNLNGVTNGSTNDQPAASAASSASSAALGASDPPPPLASSASTPAREPFFCQDGADGPSGSSPSAATTTSKSQESSPLGASDRGDSDQWCDGVYFGYSLKHLSHFHVYFPHHPRGFAVDDFPTHFTDEFHDLDASKREEGARRIDLRIDQYLSDRAVMLKGVPHRSIEDIQSSTINSDMENDDGSSSEGSEYRPSQHDRRQLRRSTKKTTPVSSSDEEDPHPLGERSDRHSLRDRSAGRDVGQTTQRTQPGLLSTTKVELAATPPTSASASSTTAGSAPLDPRSTISSSQPSQPYHHSSLSDSRPRPIVTDSQPSSSELSSSSSSSPPVRTDTMKDLTDMRDPTVSPPPPSTTNQTPSDSFMISPAAALKLEALLDSDHPDRMQMIKDLLHRTAGSASASASATATTTTSRHHPTEVAAAVCASSTTSASRPNIWVGGDDSIKEPPTPISID